MAGSDADEPGSSWAPLRRIAVTATSIVPPLAGGIAIGLEWIQSHPIIAVAIVVTYEGVVAFFAFFGAVADTLRKRWVDRMAESIDLSLTRRFNSFEKSYLQYMSASNSYIDLHGLTTRGEYTLSLDEAFVTASVDPSSTLDLEVSTVRAFAGARPASRPARSIWDWIDDAESRGSALVVVGPPGSGKTTLLKHVAYVNASSSKKHSRGRLVRRLPILLPLRDLKSQLMLQDPPSLPVMLRGQLSELDAKEPANWFDMKLRRGQVLVLLDGMDELATPSLRAKAAEWTDRQQRSYPQSIFVVTSRPFGYQENPLAVATVLQVNQFDRRQVEEFIGRWYTATSKRSFGEANDSARLMAARGSTDLVKRISESDALRSFATNPLLLTMMANVHHYRGALPGTRAELYREVCAVFLGARHQARGVELDLQASQKQVLLQKLAFEMMVANISDIKVSHAEILLRDSIDRIAPNMPASDLLKRVEDSSGLLLERENDVFSFAHQTFQEYLASVFVRENGDVGLLSSRVTDPYWHETIRLYCAESDASEIVAACVQNRSEIEVLRLAIECLEEAREIDPVVRESLFELISPGELRDDPTARQFVARLNLLLRVNRFKSLNFETAISLEPITCLEYQYFLDTVPASKPPIYWGRRFYPDDSESEPALGIRKKDALEFINFFQNEVRASAKYFLPCIEEIRESSKNLSRERHSSDRFARAWAIDSNSRVGLATLEEVVHESPSLEVAALMRSDIRQCLGEIAQFEESRFRGSSWRRFPYPKALVEDLQLRLESLKPWSLNSVQEDPTFAKALSNADPCDLDLVETCLQQVETWIKRVPRTFSRGLPAHSADRMMRVISVCRVLHLAALDYLGGSVLPADLLDTRLNYITPIQIARAIVEPRESRLVSRGAALALVGELLWIRENGKLTPRRGPLDVAMASGRRSGRRSQKRHEELVDMGRLEVDIALLASLKIYCTLAMMHLESDGRILPDNALLLVRSVSDDREVGTIN